MGWVCVLNPTERTFEELEALLEESYNYAKEKFDKKTKKQK
jgi:predicted DNA-binding protein (MmcQ/YjbR family)